MSPESLNLLAALQLRPRASWESLAPILEMSPTTLARRWRGIQEKGIAWITCTPTFPAIDAMREAASADWFYLAPHGSTAYIEIACHPGERDAVVEQLVRDPRCWTVACTSGGRDVTVAITMPSPEELDAFVHGRVGVLPGVRSLGVNPLRGFLQTASSWRIGALTAVQREALLQLPVRRPPVRSEAGRPRGLDLEVMRVLAEDGRASASRIAGEIGYSVSSVSDAIARLQASRAAEWRLDLAQSLFGWKVMATLSIRAPQARILEIGAQLRHFSQEVREAVSMISDANLQVHVWAKQLETVDAVEEMLNVQFPEVRVEDRWLSTRFAKRAGVVLDEHGRRLSVVPIFPQS